jgi:hypothetical protein
MGRRSNQLTAREVEAAKPRERDYWMVDAQTERGTGRLVLRVGTGGAKHWYFKSEQDGKRRYTPLGNYAAPPRPGQTPAGLSLDDARDEARRLANIHREHGDVKAYLESQHAAKREAEEREARERAEAERRALDAQAFTVRRLCDLYCDHLQRRGKAAHKDARSIFKVHLYAPRSR